jgi:NADH-quinone oxidoreductase subunit C
MSALALAQQLCARFIGLISEPQEFRREITLRVNDAEKITEVCACAKRELGFDYLVDISSVDLYGEDPRFLVVYHLYSYPHACSLRLKTSVPEALSELPSVTSVWQGADWHEREVYDLMGIRFRGHPDLRRLLMWDGYPYFPLRKDFPLGGKPSQVPEVAFSAAAPLEGGPFVTLPGGPDAIEREPRARTPEDAS